MNDIMLAIVIGAPFGLGLFLLGRSTLPRGRRVRGRRIAPYLSDVSTDAHALAVVSNGAIRGRRGVRVRAERLSQRLAARTVGGSSLDDLLYRAGRTESASEWTSRRLLWSLGGGLAGLIVGSVYGLSITAAGPAIAITVLGAVSGWWCPLWLLRRGALARSRELEAEMALALEFLGLSLSAGEDLVSALARVARLGSGPFTAVIRDALAQIDIGVPVAIALNSSARRVDVPALARAMEHITATLERGAPLTDVLAVQVDDVREDSKQRLIESAGKNEVLMLIPLVFLILPITIAFAVFPGIIAIQNGL